MTKKVLNRKQMKQLHTVITKPPDMFAGPEVVLNRQLLELGEEEGT